MLSLFGFIFYFSIPVYFQKYADMGRNGGLILFAFGCALLIGSFVFDLGMETQKNRGSN